MEVLIKLHLGCLVDLYVQGSIVSHISKQCHLKKKLHLF